MSLESLVDEIRRRGESELAGIEGEARAEAAKIAAERDQRVAALREEAAKATETEVARERAHRLAAAKLAARKLLYEAREQRLARAIDETRKLLAEFTGSPAYAGVLRRMFTTASAQLGKPVRVSGRPADAALLGKIAGKAFDPKPRNILGGLVAETPDGRRRLDLSFDELLRLRGDRIRELLA